MATLAELLKQKEELEQKIEAARNAPGIKFSHLKPHMTRPRAKKGATA